MLPQAQETGRSVPCCYPCVPWHRRARFQHCMVSAMPSCSRPKQFIFSWYRIHTQIPPLPPEPTPQYLHYHSVAGRSRETPTQEGTVSASHRLGHVLMLSAPTFHILLVSGSHPNTALSPQTPSPTPCTAAPWPADRARPRHRRARFQHRIASAML